MAVHLVSIHAELLILDLQQHLETLRLTIKPPVYILKSNAGNSINRLGK